MLFTIHRKVCQTVDRLRIEEPSDVFQFQYLRRDGDIHCIYFLRKCTWPESEATVSSNHGSS